MRYLFVVAIAILNSQYAQGADWMKLQSLEARDKSGSYSVVLIQPTVGSIDADNLSAGPFKDKPGIFNLYPSEFKDNKTIQLTRLSFVRRGMLIENDSTWNYLAMIEFGNNLLTGSSRTTENPNPQMTDLSFTYSGFETFKIRFGQFIAPGSHEAMKPVQAMEFLFPTQFALFTLLDWGLETTGDGTASNRPQYPNAGYRDIGVMIFDGFEFENGQQSYAVMVGNGNGISHWKDDGYADIHGRYFWTKKVQTLSSEIVLWGVSGQRKTRNSSSESTHRRERAGIDLKVDWDKWSFEIGHGFANGMIFHGTLGAGQPGVVNGSGQIASFLLLPDETAKGFNFGLGYRIDEKWYLGLRYDQINYGLKESVNERQFDTKTLSLQYKINENKPSRVVFNFESRHAKAPKLDSASAVNTFLSGLGDRATLSYFWFL